MKKHTVPLILSADSLPPHCDTYHIIMCVRHHLVGNDPLGGGTWPTMSCRRVDAPVPGSADDYADFLHTDDLPSSLSDTLADETILAKAWEAFQAARKSGDIVVEETPCGSTPEHVYNKLVKEVNETAIRICGYRKCDSRLARALGDYLAHPAIDHSRFISMLSWRDRDCESLFMFGVQNVVDPRLTTSRLIDIVRGFRADEIRKHGAEALITATDEQIFKWSDGGTFPEHRD